MHGRPESETRPEDDEAVVAFMIHLGAEPMTVTPRLADADLLWWKARLLRRWEAERRVTAPLDAVEPFQIAAGIAAGVVLTSWALPAVARMLAFIHV